jgi:hypothetical protein
VERAGPSLQNEFPQWRVKARGQGILRGLTP